MMYNKIVIILRKIYEIRNQKSEIRNQKSEIRNQKSEIRNQKSSFKKIIDYFVIAKKIFIAFFLIMEIKKFIVTILNTLIKYRVLSKKILSF